MTPASPFAFDWVRAHADATPDAPAIGTPDDGWVSYAGLQELVEATAACLAERGVGPGDIVVQVLPASARSVAAALAIQSIGAVCVELNRELGQAGFAEVLRQTDARVAVVEGRDAPRWAQLASDVPLAELFIVHREELSERLVASLSGARWASLPSTVPPDRRDGVDPVRDDPARTALLVYTSGSTGTPRGVIQTHENIDANTRAIVRYLDLTPADRAMATLPLFYCYGRSVLQTHLLVGASVFFDHRFIYPKVVLDELATQRCTSFAGVPLTFESLKRQVDIAALELSTLRYVTQAGGRMHTDTVRWVRAAFAPAELFVMYGQTEATARLSYLPPERAADKEGSVGRALDNLELRIVDDSGDPVPAGTGGNVVARGASITTGYFQADEETAAILRDGWLWTGDLGYLDDEGFLFLAGRTKDFLKLGGNRVSAAEIEDVIALHPQIKLVAVIGTVDNDGAEQAVAVAVRADGATIDAHELRRHCRQALPAFKVPRFVHFVSSLPLTASGKIAKSELQEWINDDRNVLD